MTAHETTDLIRMGKLVTLTLPMEQDFELVATKVAKALAEMVGMDADQVDEVRMAVVEACINAFEHSQAPDGLVDVTIEPMEDKLVITVADRGHGFTFDPVKTGPRVTPAGRKRGFGLRIIKEMMDDVQVQATDGGTRLVMVKCCGKWTKKG